MKPTTLRAASLAALASTLAACATGTNNDRSTATDACADGVCMPPIACRAGDPAARFATQTPPPATVTPGETIPVSVSFDNCSGQTWTPSAFTLRPTHATDATTWGITDVALRQDVPNGARVTIAFSVTAPADPGTYRFGWSISHDGVGLLAQPATDLEVAVQAATSSDASARPSDASARDASVRDAPGVDACVPNCQGNDCGSDGCGGSCGTCGPDSTCNAGHCAPQCGANGQACCANRTCSDGSLCTDTPSGPTCMCGTNGHVCCTGRSCTDGSFCTDTGFGPICLCGSNGQACCPGRTCSDGSLCTDTAYGAFCLCGHNGEICCPGRACNDGSLCTDTGFGPICLCGSKGQICCPGRTCNDGSFCTDTGFGPLCLCGTNGTVCCPGRVCTDGSSCNDTGFGPICQLPNEVSCGALQWWNTYITSQTITSSGWMDTDLGVSSSTPVQLRHDSLLTNTGVYGWGYMPEFTDQVTGIPFRMLHLRPQNQNATNIGQVYPAGFIVGLSGGDTADTGLGTYSTGAHLCIQTPGAYSDAFPSGVDACR